MRPELKQVYSDKDIKRLIKQGRITNTSLDEATDPSSLSLRVGNKVWYLSANVNFPRGRDVPEFLNSCGALEDYQEIRDGNKIEIPYQRPCVIELAQNVEMPYSATGSVMAKSGIGRVFTSARGVTNRTGLFDFVPSGYEGPLYVMVCPNASPLVAIAGETAIPQIRFFEGLPKRLRGSDIEEAITNVGEPMILDENDGAVKFSREALEDIIRTGRIPLTANIQSLPNLYLPRENGQKIYLNKKDNAVSGVYREVNLRGQPGHVSSKGELLFLPIREHIRMLLDYCAEIVSEPKERGGRTVEFARMVNCSHGLYPEEIKGDPCALEVSTEEPWFLTHGCEIGALELYGMRTQPSEETWHVNTRTTSFDELIHMVPKFFEVDRERIAAEMGLAA